MSAGRSAAPSTCHAGRPVAMATWWSQRVFALSFPPTTTMASTFSARSTRLCCRRSVAGQLVSCTWRPGTRRWRMLRDAAEPVARKRGLPDRDARPGEHDRLGLLLGGHHDRVRRVPPDSLHLDVAGIAHDDHAVAPGRVLAHEVLDAQHVGAGGVHADHPRPPACRALLRADAVGTDDHDAVLHLGEAAHGHDAPSTVLLDHPRVVDERTEGVHGLARVLGERALEDRERTLHPATGPEGGGADDGHAIKVAVTAARNQGAL